MENKHTIEDGQLLQRNKQQQLVVECIFINGIIYISKKLTEDEKIYSDFNNGLDKKKVKLKYITSKFITITLEKMI